MSGSTYDGYPDLTIFLEVVEEGGEEAEVADTS